MMIKRMVMTKVLNLREKKAVSLTALGESLKNLKEFRRKIRK
jgi:hypothetical protein